MPVLALEAIPVGVVVYSDAVALVVVEFPLVPAAIAVVVCPGSLPLAIDGFALVTLPLCVVIDSEALPLAIDETAFVGVAVREGKLPLAVHGPIDELSLVDRPIWLG